MTITAEHACDVPPVLPNILSKKAAIHNFNGQDNYLLLCEEAEEAGSEEGGDDAGLVLETHTGIFQTLPA